MELGSCAGVESHRKDDGAAIYFYEKKNYGRGPRLLDLSFESWRIVRTRVSESRRRRGHESPPNMPRKKNMGP